MKKTRMIETYLDGSISKEEREKTETLIASNEEFAAEIQLYKNINDAILDDRAFEFRNNIITLFDDKKAYVIHEQKPFMRYLKYPVAAVILALIGLSLFQILTLKEPGELYSLYYKPYESDISTRSVINSSDKTQMSYILYQERNFETSFDILEKYLSVHQDDMTARFYYALNAIELNENELAISELKSIEDNAISPFALHARWYLALIYLRSDQPEKAKKYLLQLSDTENLYSDKATKILKKLKS
jgi:hypothetical protein